ncbi:hypothetical protein [Alkalimarinus coralli]|uniref:hypothetical protein n=1 Tax=Alkalimarinus coralli TaxID=2935863 RepID=UPI00202AC675|nr:hypothetical protein [Alkalimarinus coralli]
MSLSLNQVEELLATGGDTRTLDDLIDIVKNVSANVNGVTSDSTYLLYSGTILDDPSTVVSDQ